MARVLPQTRDVRGAAAPYAGPMTQPLPTFDLRADRFRVLVSGEEAGGRYAVIETLARQGSELPVHVHAREDELLLVLEGRLRVRLGPGEHRLASGDVLRLPRGVPHALRLDTPSARLLTIYCPGGFERYLEAVAQPAPLPGAAPLPRAAGPPDVPRLVMNAALYGLVYFPAQED